MWMVLNLGTEEAVLGHAMCLDASFLFNVSTRNVNRIRGSVLCKYSSTTNKRSKIENQLAVRYAQFLVSTYTHSHIHTNWMCLVNDLQHNPTNTFKKKNEIHTISACVCGFHQVCKNSTFYCSLFPSLAQTVSFSSLLWVKMFIQYISART